MTKRIAVGVLLAGLVAGCAAEPEPATVPSSDYAVYTAVIREHFLGPHPGEHGLLCEDGLPATHLEIGEQTRPLWAWNARRDSAAAAELPPVVAPVLAALRALDSLPRRLLAADSFAVGVPVRLSSDSLTGRRTRGAGGAVHEPADSAPPLITFSRVAYSADGSRALVYATRACREKPVGEAEEGAEGSALLVPLERRGATWAAPEPVYLHLD